ncbi:NapC/NirT family cytochrome c [Salipaludibacillus sp. CUR1]|uniref:cytochrome c3 family protein n=1 Tax=Salipaludibacillus sp. CUR1 TaxID=2820003 RepID=UPI001E32CFB6|nr:NapC/NirT family cytochrome c [Salipaludibacillus sp. CUR1]MCE7792495.1 NapC/NirT family cytochrome c [Salipaludibacillus sp. CUR1]
MKKLRRLIDKRALLFILGGVFLGIALFAGTAGSMKATDSAEFCASCHIMDTAYQSYSESNHATLSCNDCHAPTDSLTSKVAFKAKAGVSHMYMNTLGSEDVPDVIHATDGSQEVIEANCISCHEASLENVEFHDVKEGGCIDCHRHVPHGNKRYKPADWFEPGEYDARS